MREMSATHVTRWTRPWLPAGCRLAVWVLCGCAERLLWVMLTYTLSVPCARLGSSLGHPRRVRDGSSLQMRGRGLGACRRCDMRVVFGLT